MFLKNLPWDTKFFSFKMANLVLNDEANLKNLDNLVQRNKIKFVQCCLEVEKIKQINTLEKNGFNFADLKISYSLNLKGKKYQRAKNIKRATKEDLPKLKKIAAAVFDQSRFYHPGFNPRKAGKLYELWLENSIRGVFDDFCYKIEDSATRTVGFITGKSTSKNFARIGLIGVAKNFQSQGFGKLLLDTLCHFYQQRSKKYLEVATQGKNIKANNFYLKNGFLLCKIESWYYKFY